MASSDLSDDGEGRRIEELYLGPGTSTGSTRFLKTKNSGDQRRSAALLKVLGFKTSRAMIIPNSAEFQERRAGDRKRFVALF